MKQEDQIEENKLAIIIEIGSPGQTVLPKTMADCLSMIEQTAASTPYTQSPTHRMF